MHVRERLAVRGNLEDNCRGPHDLLLIRIVIALRAVIVAIVDVFVVALLVMGLLIFGSH